MSELNEREQTLVALGAAIASNCVPVSRTLPPAVNTFDGRIDQLQEGDFWENVDDQGQPYLERDGTIFSDPGHSLEFVGLAARLIAEEPNK